MDLSKWHLEPGSTQESVSALFSSFRQDLEPVGSSAATSITTLFLPCATLSVALSYGHTANWIGKLPWLKNNPGTIGRGQLLGLKFPDRICHVEAQAEGRPALEGPLQRGLLPQEHSALCD